MYGNEREKEIISLLEKTNYATVEYLAEKIHISPSSIRRDLKRLEMKGLVIRSYGGAELNESANRRIPFNFRSHQNTKEKAMVAKAAAELVKPGDVIFIDCSSTTYFMVEYLKDIKGITVITNSLASMCMCSDYNINAYITGGRISSESGSSLYGHHTENVINSFHANYCFFSVQSLTKNGDLYDCFGDELIPRKLMMKNSDKNVFLCDHTKINHYSAYFLCDLSDVDYVISDTDLKGYLDKEYNDVYFVNPKG